MLSGQVAELVRSPQLPSTALSVDLGTHGHQGVDLQQHVEVWVAVNPVGFVPVQYMWLHCTHSQTHLHFSNKIGPSYSHIWKLVHVWDC